MDSIDWMQIEWVGLVGREECVVEAVNKRIPTCNRAKLEHFEWEQEHESN